ncbi:MAG TPA: ectonucleotide pyrophosphatase/phosphodiesterase [Pyrinomonadaceae bacterium]|nr:ectonucleotide pyrophosphatase/phosphodiesterase [Pyrinomonadaceae bacterium]
MSKRAYRLGLAVLLAVVCLFTQAQAAPARRVLLLSIDGLDARYLARRDELKLRIPTLRRLLDEGLTARAGVISVYPSLTYPAHTTLVTGARPARHGVFGNEVFDPLRASTPGIWYASAIKADTLWDAARRAGLSTGLVSWPVAAGAGDWNTPEFWRPGGTYRDAATDIAANARPAGLVEEIAARDPALYALSTKDEQDDMRTRFAEYIIETKRPRLMLVHLYDFDHYQHDFGPFAPASHALLEKSDAYLARLLAAYERAALLDETAVFIVSDHGFLPVSQRVHPGVLLERAGLLQVREDETNEGGRRRVRVTDWRAGVYVTAGSCSIILRDPRDTDALRRVRRALTNFLRQQRRTGRAPAFRILEAREVRRLGANPRAALMLEGGAGYSFGANVTGEVIVADNKRGNHGYLPTIPNYRAAFIASGAGITRRGEIGALDITDIAPTIAHLLGLKLKDAEGRALRVKR